MEVLSKIEGEHYVAVFLMFAFAGLAVVVLDQYVFTKLESAVGVTPTVF